MGVSAVESINSKPGSERDREIVSAEVIVTCPARNFVTLKIVTRSGVSGIGDATLNGRELAVASYLKDHLVPNLIGRDAGRIEDIWQFFYRGAYWRRGPVTMTAISAVDVALWDILGKMSGLPVYRLLGGRSREGALVYGHANGKDIDECSAEVGKYIAQGYKAVRAQCGVPGVKKAYGISSLKNAYEPAESELPPKPSGQRRSISTSCRSCSNGCARTTDPTSNFCMTCITA